MDVITYPCPKHILPVCHSLNIFSFNLLCLYILNLCAIIPVLVRSTDGAMACQPGLVSLMSFHSNSNLMEILFHSPLASNTMMATTFCMWHNNCAVVACAKICCNLMANYGIAARRNFHQIWIADKKSLVKWAPGQKLFVKGMLNFAKILALMEKTI